MPTNRAVRANNVHQLPSKAPVKRRQQRRSLRSNGQWSITMQVARGIATIRLPVSQFMKMFGRLG